MNEKQMSESFLTAVFLTLSGGLQDAYTYLCRDGVFANAQTGNIVRMSAFLFSGEISESLLFLIPLLSFAAGIFIAEAVRRKFRQVRTVHWRQIILTAEIILLFAVAFIPQSLNTAANAAVSFVCAMQVQSFRTVGGSAYASTMCIGNMRSGVDALAAFFYEKNISHLKNAGKYFGVIGLFAAGAGIGRIAVTYFNQRAIWVSCILLTAGFFMMFKKSETKTV